MSLTLSMAKERVSLHLHDAGQLIWTDAMLGTAIRAALQTIASVQGEPLSLSGLDGAAETTLAQEDEQALVTGSVAYALTFRAAGRFEAARAGEDLPDALADWAGVHMTRFQTLLAQVKRRGHQTAAGPPYAAWDWKEERG